MAEKNWIAGATSKHKGSFSAAAKAAGKSTAEYAREKYHDKGTLGKRARLAYTLMGLHGKKSTEPKPSKAHTLYKGD